MISQIQLRFPKLTLTKVSRHLVSIVLIFLVVYQTSNGVRPYILAHCRIIVDPHTYPVAAMRFLQRNNIKGNLILPFDWGEYGIWKLHPDCRVSIDGRFRTVYPESVIQDHFVADNDTAQWRTLIEKYPSDILLTRQIPFFQALIQQGGPWVYVYSDPVAIVFMRNSQKNQKVLQRFEAGQFEYPESPPSVYFP